MWCGLFTGMHHPPRRGRIKYLLLACTLQSSSPVQVSLPSFLPAVAGTGWHAKMNSDFSFDTPGKEGLEFPRRTPRGYQFPGTLGNLGNRVHRSSPPPPSLPRPHPHIASLRPPPPPAFRRLDTFTSLSIRTISVGAQY